MGKTGLLAQSAAVVSCVTNRVVENVSEDGPEDVRNTFFSLDFRPATRSGFGELKMGVRRGIGTV